MKPTYTIGTNPDSGRQTLTLNLPMTQIPFNGSVVFEFASDHLRDRLESAERILHGAMWEKEL